MHFQLVFIKLERYGFSFIFHVMSGLLSTVCLSDVYLGILSRIRCYCIDLVLSFLFRGFRVCLYQVVMRSLVPMSAF